MNNIHISLSEVTQCAQQIRACSARMYELLMQMKQDMNSLNGSWISDGGQTIRERFNQFANRFEIQKENIDSYGQFLDLTVSSYDGLESTIQANANSF